MDSVFISIIKWALQFSPATLVSIILTGTTLFIAYRRVRSPYLLVRRLLKDSSSISKSKNESVRQVLQDIQEVQEFRLLSGIQVNSKYQMEAVAAWCLKNKADVCEVAACGKSFDFKKMRPLRGNRWEILLLILFTAMISLCTIGFGAFSVTDRLILEMKGSGTDFLMTEKKAYAKNGTTVLTPESCPSLAPQNLDGFLPSDAKIICAEFADPNWPQIFATDLREQKLLALLFAVQFLFWSVLLLGFLDRTVAARDLHVRVYGPQSARNIVRLRRLYRTWSSRSSLLLIAHIKEKWTKCPLLHIVRSK